jgi:nucleoside-diphosphate-sugar epimerase
MVWGLVSEDRTNHQEARSLRIVTSPDVLIFCATFECVLTFAPLREIFSVLSVLCVFVLNSSYQSADLSDRPLIVTSGTGLANTVPDQPALEDNPIINSSVIPRAASEEAAASLAARGANVSVVRLPQVHDPVKQGLVTYAILVAREKGVSPYVGDGLNRWPAAHVHDTARLYRLALEKNDTGAKYHAVAEEGVALRDIAEVIGKGLKVPVVSISQEEAPAHFGWLAMFLGRDSPASSALTQRRLGWHPTGPGLIADLEQMNYFAS